jgi:DMSO/TMAO reductase YedYZ heme-binding membrane subunit
MICLCQIVRICGLLAIFFVTEHFVHYCQRSWFCEVKTSWILNILGIAMSNPMGLYCETAETTHDGI